MAYMFHSPAILPQPGFTSPALCLSAEAILEQARARSAPGISSPSPALFEDEFQDVHSAAYEYDDEKLNLGDIRLILARMASALAFSALVNWIMA